MNNIKHLQTCNILTKSEFIKIMKDLQILHDLDKNINSAYRKANTETSFLDFDFLNSDTSLTEYIIIYILNRMFFQPTNEKEGIISYFIYDLDFGRNLYTEVYEALDLSSSDKLYDYLLSNQHLNN